MASYMGHRSWNAWNICLWIRNVYETYKYCHNIVSMYGVEKAARMYTKNMKGQRTPDGAKYNYTCIRECFSSLKGA